MFCQFPEVPRGLGSKSHHFQLLFGENTPYPGCVFAQRNHPRRKVSSDRRVVHLEQSCLVEGFQIDPRFFFEGFYVYGFWIPALQSGARAGTAGKMVCFCQFLAGQNQKLLCKKTNTGMVRFSMNFLDRHNKSFMVEKFG